MTPEQRLEKAFKEAQSRLGEGSNEGLGGLYREVYVALEEFYAHQTSASLVSLADVQGAKTPTADLVDAGFFMRQVEYLADTIRKDAKRRKTLISRLLCMRVASGHLKGDEVQLRGQYATGLAEVSPLPIVPKAGSPEYFKLMEWLGVPSEVVEQGSLRVSFTHMVAHLKRMAAEGKTPPEGLVSIHDDPIVVYRKRR